jgi:peptidyl-prolyl cis-trans isomerase B (cyclophilin B)
MYNAIGVRKVGALVGNKLSALFLSVALSGAVTNPALAAAGGPMRPILQSELAKAPDPALAGLLASSNPDVAARAALALGRIGNPESRPLLRPLLRAPEARVRAMAAYGLGLLTDPDSLATLGTLATDDPNSAVRYAALDAVGRILTGDPTLASADLAARLETALGDRDSVVRGHAAANTDAFRKSPSAPAMAEALGRRYLAERDADVRWHLMWALFRGYADVAARAILLQGLHDSSDLVRIEAVRAWGRRSDPDAADLVRPLLDDPSWRVQLQAREALHQIAKEPMTEHLTELPPGLHFPPSPPPETREPPLPHTAPGKLAAPVLDDVAFAPLYAPTTALEMNGPMPGPHPRVRITTTKGDIVLRLYPEWAPVTVANFLRLANGGYFDGNRWFRIVPDFVVQTGDPHDNPDGDAGFMIRAELNPVEQRAGIISMGLNYDKDHALRDSAGSQFYITLSPQLHLDRDFTVFGEIASGFDVLAHLIESDRMIRVEQLIDG